MRPLQRYSAVGLGLLFVAGAAMVFYLNAGTRIQIQVDGRHLSFATNARTVVGALSQAGVSLEPADRVAPALDDPINPAVPIIVTRAPLVSLSADGHSYLVHAPTATPRGLLSSVGIVLTPGDELLGDGLPLAEAQILGPMPRSLVLRRAVDVTIDESGAGPRSARTAATSVGEALWSLGYQLYVSDMVQPALDAPVTPGVRIELRRSRLVAVQADGGTVQFRTRAATVAEALSGLGLALVGADYSVPAEDQPIPGDGQIGVVRVREEILADQKLIPFDTIFQAMPNVEIDNVQQLQTGVPGVQRRLTRVRYENGVEVARATEAEAQVQKPVSQIIGYGTQIVIRTLDTPDGPVEYWRAFTMYATSYAAKFTDRVPGTSSYGRTASGKILTKGLVAIDRRLIAFGTRMYVPGYGFAEAADIGSGVKGRFIDLGFDDFNYENWHWPVTVYFLAPAPPAGQIRWIIPSTVP